MSHSPEYLAAVAMKPPSKPRIGDLWLDRRLGIIRVFNGHQRSRSRKYPRLNSFHLYHWGQPSLYAHPCDWRDDDNNAGSTDLRGSIYIGNIFELLPYHVLAREEKGQFKPDRVEGPFPQPKLEAAAKTPNSTEKG